MVETQHATYRAVLGLAGVKSHDMPRPFRYPRPHDPEPTKPPAATRAEIAARIPRR